MAKQAELTPFDGSPQSEVLDDMIAARAHSLMDRMQSLRGEIQRYTIMQLEKPHSEGYAYAQVSEARIRMSDLADELSFIARLEGLSCQLKTSGLHYKKQAE